MKTMSSLTICLAAQDPPDGPPVLLAIEGMGKVHFVNDERTGAVCGVDIGGMTSGWLRPPVPDDHSDFCKDCVHRHE